MDAARKLRGGTGSTRNHPSTASRSSRPTSPVPSTAWHSRNAASRNSRANVVSRSSVRRQLEETLLRDTTLAREFRLAALRLCQAVLGTGDVGREERDAAVGRHSARSILVALAAWRARVLGTGLVLDIDLSRLAIGRRPPVEERAGTYYTKAAAMDAYEVLRQLVDATDQLRGVFAAVTVVPELLTDDVRGLPAYLALQLRIVDEVRDRRRPNPFAALVRLETRLEAVR